MIFSPGISCNQAKSSLAPGRSKAQLKSPSSTTVSSGEISSRQFRSSSRVTDAVATAAALATSFGGLWLRKRAMARYGQSATGFVEDALLVGSGLAVAHGLKPE